jgi:hypothetical protein
MQLALRFGGKIALKLRGLKNEIESNEKKRTLHLKTREAACVRIPT